jgi:cysteine synthase A
MGRIYESIIETIGNTPVVRINRLAPQGVNLFVKVEAFNPLGSVKDRLALGVIEAAEKSGELKPGQTVIEAKRKHRNRSCDGLRSQGIPACNHHGRAI